MEPRRGSHPEPASLDDCMQPQGRQDGAVQPSGLADAAKEFSGGPLAKRSSTRVEPHGSPRSTSAACGEVSAGGRRLRAKPLVCAGLGARYRGADSGVAKTWPCSMTNPRVGEFQGFSLSRAGASRAGQGGAQRCFRWVLGAGRIGRSAALGHSIGYRGKPWRIFNTRNRGLAEPAGSPNQGIAGFQPLKPRIGGIRSPPKPM